jgi:transposase
MNELETKVYVGVDVSKAYLDVYIHPTGQTLKVSNDEMGIQQFIDLLIKQPAALIVLEATGGYEKTIARALEKTKQPISVVNPRRVRDFAKALGQLAKTDKIDSHVLALFAEKIQPTPRPLKSLNQQALADLKARRKQLVDMITMEKNRLDKANSSIRKGIEKTIKFLEKELKAIDEKLSEAIQEDPEFSRKDKMLRDIKGVGPVLSITLLADLSELGELNHKKIAALVGVAPFNRDSGTFTGGKTVWGGRGSVRSALYMATLAATRFNPQIKMFYERLCKAGKAKKVALTACMHKLLIIMNAIIKSGIPWKSDFKNA